MRYIIGLSFDILNCVLQGWALSILWGWFIVPKFGLETLTIPQAIGLILVVGFVTSSIPNSNEINDEHFGISWEFLWDYLMDIFFKVFTTLGIGWVVVEYFI